ARQRERSRIRTSSTGCRSRRSFFRSSSSFMSLLRYTIWMRSPALLFNCVFRLRYVQYHHQPARVGSPTGEFKRTGQHKMSIAERLKPGPGASLESVVVANVCPLCLNGSRVWLISRDRHVRRCQHCGFIWVPEGLSRNPDGQSIYEADKPIFFDDGNENYYLDDASFTNARIKLKLVRQIVPSGAKLIDLGAGFGHFIKLAQEHYAATGLEISSVAVKWGRQRLGANLITGPLDAPLSGLHQKFDVVTMWDVIEHLENPLSALHS